VNSPRLLCKLKNVSKYPELLPAQVLIFMYCRKFRNNFDYFKEFSAKAFHFKQLTRSSKTYVHPMWCWC